MNPIINSSICASKHFISVAIISVSLYSPSLYYDRFNYLRYVISQSTHSPIPQSSAVNPIRPCIHPAIHLSIDLSMHRSSHSFIHPFIRLGHALSVELWLRASGPNGVVFYNGQMASGRGDFIALNLVDAFLEFRFNLGSGPAVVRCARSMNE